MASSAQVSLVAATAALLASNTMHDDVPMTVVVNNGSAAAIQLGGSGVTATTGYNLAAGATVTFNLVSGDSLYAFSTLAATPVNVLTSP